MSEEIKPEIIKKRKSKPKPYRTFYISELYVNTLSKLAEEYDCSVMSILDKAIAGQPLKRKKPETIRIDEQFDDELKNIRSNLTQLHLIIAYAKELKDDFPEYTKVMGYKGKSYTYIDLISVIKMELEQELSYFINLQKRDYKEQNKRVLSIVQDLPKDQESRLAKRNSRQPGNHRGKSVYYEFDSIEAKMRFEALSLEYFRQKKYDNEDDNMMNKPSIPATLAQLIRNLKQEVSSYGFSNEQVQELREAAIGWNNDIREMNTAKKRNVQMDLALIIKQTNAFTKRLKDLKEQHKQTE